MASKLNYKLLSGHEMPLIGCTFTINFFLILAKIDFIYSILVGTFQIHGRKLIRDVLDFALAAGYRSIGKY